MQRKFIYFINPVSGTKKKSGLQKLITEKTREQHIPFTIQDSNPEGDYAYLKEKIKLENITDIIICGGDGTVSQVANALLGVNVNIGIIPMGSGNGLAFAAKIPKQPLKALQIIFQGTSSLIDAFYINERFSCMLCGIGFDAQVAHDFAKQKKRGLKTYIKQSLINFFKASPYPFEITVNGTTFSTQAYFISIANSNQFGNNFTIAPSASLCDGLLDIVVVKKMSKLRMVWTIFNQLRAGKVIEYHERNFHLRNILYFQTDHIDIYNPSLAPLHIDGDPAGTSNTFSVKIIPSAIRLLQPLKSST